MGSKQMDLSGGEAKPGPLRALANIESEARAMLEDFGQGRICIVGRHALAKDAAGDGLGGIAPQPDVADHVLKPCSCPMCKQAKSFIGSIQEARLQDY